MEVGGWREATLINIVRSSTRPHFNTHSLSFGESEILYKVKQNKAFSSCFQKNVMKEL